MAHDSAPSSPSHLYPADHATSIFSPELSQHSQTMETANPPALPGEMQQNSRAAYNSVEPHAPSRRPQLYAISRPSSSRKANIHRAEKDFDDVESPQSRRQRSLHAPDAATSSTLNRIFGGKFTTSPPVSRQSSYDTKTYSRSTYPGASTMPDHLYSRGLLQGRHSDVTVKAFGKSYRLHRIVLDRAPFFSSALSGPWLEASQKEIELHPEDIDTNITQISFELALKRMYGCSSDVEEDAAASALLATGCWLEMQDLVDASVDAILRKMQVTQLAPILQLVTSNYYGRPGDKILGSAKAMLSRDGWLMPLRCWDDVPSELVRELIAADGFFVDGEWERFVLTKRLLDRRLKAAAMELGLWESVPTPELHRLQVCRPAATRISFGMDDQTSPPVSDSSTGEYERWLGIYTHLIVEPLLRLLDEGVHYIHMTFEQLQEIRSARDVLGVPLVSDKTVADALWSSLELRQKVVNAREKELTLNLSHHGRRLDSTRPRTVLRAASTRSGKERAVDVQSTGPAETQHAAQAPCFWIPSTDCNIIVSDTSEYTPQSTRHTQLQAPKIENLHPPEPISPWSLDIEGESVSPGDAQPTSYTTFPPFRFSAEFPGPRALRYKERVYSRTVFYAGSYWNVYIQKVLSVSKTPQLGIYLHRARNRTSESHTGRAAVDQRIDALEQEMSLRKQQRLLRWSNRPPSRMSRSRQDENLDETSSNYGTGSHVVNPTPHGPGFLGSADSRNAAHIAWGSGSRNLVQADTSRKATNQDAGTGPVSSSSTSPADEGLAISSSDEDEEHPTADAQRAQRRASRRSNPALAPYIDVRPTIKAYFKIFSPLRGGRILSVYESAPDHFNFRQCWGWRSSDLMLEEPDEDNWGDQGDDSNAALQAAMGATTGQRGGEASEDELAGVESRDGGRTEELSGVVGEEGLKASGQSKERKNLRFMIVLGVV